MKTGVGKKIKILSKTKIWMGKSAKLSLVRRGPDSGQDTEASADLAELIAYARRLQGIQVNAEFRAILRALFAHRAQFEDAFIAWIDLIESLVQAGEHRYPNGNGAFKKAQTKSAIHQIITRRPPHLPYIPDYIEPIVLDIAVDITVDVLVASVDKNCLWETHPERIVVSCLPLPKLLLSKLICFMRPVLAVLGAAFLRLYRAFTYYAPLVPEVQKAVDAFVEEGIVLNKRQKMEVLGQFILFIGNNRDQMVALVNLVFEAANIAARLVEKTPEERFTYAEDLVKAVMRDLGFPVDGGLIGILASAFIRAALRAAVTVFEKRARPLDLRAPDPEPPPDVFVSPIIISARSPA